MQEGSGIFSQVFRRKNPVTKIGLSGRAGGGRAAGGRVGGAFLVNVLVNLLADLFFHKVFNQRSSNFTHGFFRVSAF